MNRHFRNALQILSEGHFLLKKMDEYDVLRSMF